MSLIKDLTPLGLGVGALYLLSRTNLFNTVGESVGAASSGLGYGVGQIGYGAGNIVGSTAEAVGNVFALTSAYKSSVDVLNARLQTVEDQILREAKQKTIVDEKAFAQSAEQQAKYQAEAEIFQAQQETIRSKQAQKSETALSSFAYGGFLPGFIYRGTKTISDFVKSQVSVNAPKSDEKVSEEKKADTGTTDYVSRSSGGRSRSVTQKKKDTVTFGGLGYSVAPALQPSFIRQSFYRALGL